MFDLKRIRENPDLIKIGAANKNDSCDIDKILDLDNSRRDLIQQSDTLKAERNSASAEIARKKKAGESADDAVAAMREVGSKITVIDKRLREIEQNLHELLSWIPNLPHDSVPVGKDEADNVIVREWGEIGKPDFDVLPHWEIGSRLGILDMEAAARISGSGFYLLKGAGARLHRALVNYMLDLHIKDGFVEVTVPHLVTSGSMFGTGQLPKLGSDMYHIAEDNLWLIPTAEVPVTNIYKEQILDHAQLPICHVAHTPCYRREAGAAGKDTRGMIRVHQFDKVEMVKVVRPEHSYDELESLVRQAEKVLQGLELPYRVTLLATGDLSFAAAKCYDIELWSGGVHKYLEISSVSNFEEFQARRMKCRFRNEERKLIYPHTLNGSGVALARLIPTILENYQTAEGTVVIPPVLRQYMGGREMID